MQRKTVQLPFEAPPKDAAALKKLSQATRISQAAFLREALRDLLAKYRKEVRT